jgi:hypothetical protein
MMVLCFTAIGQEANLKLIIPQQQYLHLSVCVNELDSGEWILKSPLCNVSRELYSVCTPTPLATVANL